MTTKQRPNPFEPQRPGPVDLKRADKMICEIRTHIEDNEKRTQLDWSFFDSVEEQFLATGKITPRQFEAIENIHASINN